jgi:hypothetical protein
MNEECETNHCNICLNRDECQEYVLGAVCFWETEEEL